MKELMEFYKKWKKIVIIICFFLWLFFLWIFSLVDDGISDFINQNIVNEGIAKIVEYVFDVLFDLGAPTTIIYGIYCKIMKSINEDYWKKFFPELDISGEWEDITIYTKQFDDYGIKKISDTKVPSPVKISQTCKKIEIQQSVGEDFMWYSLMTDWQNDKLIILYKVEYNSNLQSKGFPEQRIGVECMSVKDIGVNGRPTKMVGNFHHCVYDDNKPIFMGDVIYKRSE